MNNFRWNMTKEDYKRMQRASKEKKVPSDNFYGAVAIGSILFEWVGEQDCDDHDYYYVNCFEAGIDAGYGNLADGTPYNCIDHWLPYVSLDLSFDKFKRTVEEEIKSMDGFQEKIDKDVEPMWYGF